MNCVPGVDGVVAADGGEELCEERDEEVVGRDDVHEEVVGHLADLQIVNWVFITGFHPFAEPSCMVRGFRNLVPDYASLT